jgi:hypothetical protein
MELLASTDCEYGQLLFFSDHPGIQKCHLLITILVELSATNIDKNVLKFEK